MDGAKPIANEGIVEDSSRKLDEQKSKQQAEISTQMRQLLQGLRTAATNSVLEGGDDLDELARRIDAARQRRTSRHDDHA